VVAAWDGTGGVAAWAETDGLGGLSGSAPCALRALADFTPALRGTESVFFDATAGEFDATAGGAPVRSTVAGALDAAPAESASSTGCTEAPGVVAEAVSGVEAAAAGVGTEFCREAK
jgi:hypothetical protein